MSKKDDLLRLAMSELGRLGGKASGKKLTARERTERARKAGLARQAKARKAAKKGGVK
jgi:general stress protein YciG